MMQSTYKERLRVLREITGCREGAVAGQVTVDQVYAHYQHERLDLHHPRGGEAKFLERPLMENFRDYLAGYARDVLEHGGQRAMQRAMEHLSDQVEVRAPVEFADLRRSGHPEVFIGGRRVYNREPKVGRLSEEELRRKARLRKLPPQILGYIWWHVMHKTEPPPRHSRWAG
jgi:hypothetical protein